MMQAIHTIPAGALALVRSNEAFEQCFILKHLVDVGSADSASDLKTGTNMRFDSNGIHFSASAARVDVVIEPGSVDETNFSLIRKGSLKDGRIHRGENVELLVSYPDASRIYFALGTVLSIMKRGKVTIVSMHFEETVRDAVMVEEAA